MPAQPGADQSGRHRHGSLLRGPTSHALRSAISAQASARMTAAISLDGLQQGLTAVQDVVAAISAGLTDIPADEAALLDVAKIAALIDPVLAPLVVVLPIAEAIVAWVIANNTQGRPGSQTPMRNSGARGNAN